MKKILVAEDNDSNYVLMTYLLKKDFEFERAKNGQIAVEMCDANAYDLVLMDIKMPIMDGLQATRLIKEKHPDLPVVALTANAFDSDRTAAEKAGCCGFLSKPVNRDECMTLLKKLLGRYEDTTIFETKTQKPKARYKPLPEWYEQIF